jgi:hypothetical protein
MARKNIFIGFEEKTGKKVEIPLAHLIVTGITNLSGKTTCIEALIKRSGLKAIIFKTKIGEAGISEGTVIPPYFKENSSWQYVQSLLEATLKERLKFERSWIIDACRNTNSLFEVKANIDGFLAEGRNAQGRTLNALSRSIYTTLQAYFEIILPQLQYANFSKTLEMREGINIIDLERFKVEIQSLVMRSVLETVLNEHKGVIIVIPEFWKFCPQTRGSPVKQVAEEFIRQGATNQNYLWADSMPPYEVILTKIEGKIRTLTFEDLFNLNGEIKNTSKGEEIKILRQDVQVLDTDGHRLKWFKLKKVFRHKYNGKILSINTVDGVIDVSPNHPIMKYPRYTVEADKLKIGDRVQSRLIGKKWQLHNNKELFVGTEELAWLSGFFCAEGWINGKHICFANKNKQLLEKAQKIIETNFHYSASFTSPVRGVFTLDNKSPKLANYFKTNCYNRNILNSSTKIVPISVLNAPIEIKKAFLEGYLQGDGSFDKKRGYWRDITTTSRLLALGVVELYNAIYGRMSYSLHLRNDKPNVIQIRINKNKNQKKRDTIKKIIEKSFKGYLYDIEINSPKHTFYMGIGNIRVHNSQDLAGVDKTSLKQVSVWILGLQQERNEVKHTLDQIPLSKSLKPKPEDIMTLSLGHFYISTPDMVKKVYVLPAWLDEARGKNVALGKLKVENIQKPSAIAQFSMMPKPQENVVPNFESQKVYAKVQQDMIEMRQDFFNKQQQMQDQFERLAQEMYKLQTQKQEVNIDDIVSRVLQKIPVKENVNQQTPNLNFDKETLIREIMTRIPRMAGTVTYEVAPLEKLKKGFLENAKNKILSDISKLSDDAKKTLKYVETMQRGVSTNEIVEKGFLLRSGGGNSQKIVESLRELDSFQLVRRNEGGKSFPKLKEEIKAILGNFQATEPEIEQVYSHILAEMLGG